MVKRKQLTTDEATRAQGVASKIPVRLLGVDIQESLRLAIKFNIYAYDAYFIECARSMSCPLLTLDKKMKHTAFNLNVEILE